MVDLARPGDPGADRAGRLRTAGGLLSDTAPRAADTDALLASLREAAGDAPLPPLTIEADAVSTRRGPAGRLVSGARRAVVRLIAPSLAELVAQLERDRHRQRGELQELRRRVEALERAAAAADRPGGGRPTD